MWDVSGPDTPVSNVLPLLMGPVLPSCCPSASHLTAASSSFVSPSGQMPVMDGRTATSLIRKWETENKCEPNWIVAITGNASMEDREECMRAGVNDYLNKPVSRELIEQLLDDRVRQMGAGDFSPAPSSNFAPAYSGGFGHMGRTASSLFKDCNFARTSTG